MSNLELMFNNGMKGLGSIYLGRQMADDKTKAVADAQMAAEKLRGEQLANENSATMNPLNAQFRQGEVAAQRAMLPGVEGQSQVLAAGGQEATQTMGAKVAAKLSALTTQMDEDGVKRMGMDGDRLLQASQSLDRYPPALHKQVLTKFMQAYGSSPDSPMIQGILRAPDAMVKAAAQAMGIGMAAASKKYITESLASQEEQGSRERIAKGNNDATRYSADRAAESRTAAAEARASVLKRLKPADKIAALQELKASGEASPQELALLEDMLKHDYTRAAIRNNAIPAELMDKNTPVQNAAEAAREGAGRGPEPAAGNGDIAALAKQQGIVYDPNNYDYKIVDGVIHQRRKAPKR